MQTAMAHVASLISKCASISSLIHLQTREIVDAMRKDADLSELKVLKVDGGASNNNLLMQALGSHYCLARCDRIADVPAVLLHHARA